MKKYLAIILLACSSTPPATAYTYYRGADGQLKVQEHDGNRVHRSAITVCIS